MQNYMSRKNYIPVIVFLLTLLLTPTYVKAQDDTSYTFVGTYYPLILEKDEANKLHGLGVDLLSEISRSLDIKIDILFLPWGRALKMVKDGKADGILGIYKTEERKNFLVYTDLFIKNDDMMVITKSDSEIPWNGELPSLQGQHIITIKFWGYGGKFDAYKHNLDITEASKLSHAIEMLSRNRGDILLANKQSVLYELENMKINSDFSFIEPPVLNVPSYFAFSKIKEDYELQNRFNAALHQLKNSGRLAELVNKYTLATN